MSHSPALPTAGCPVRVVPLPAERDMPAAEQAAADLLSALGVALDSEALRQTPLRLARAWAELLTPRPFDATTFPNEEGYNQLVVECAVPFQSLCEHHMLAFTGHVHLGYLPGDRIVGLSKLARLVEHFARRPQVQERMTQQIADWLHEHLGPKGVGVIVTAQHSCMTLRGAQVHGARTVTSALHGLLLKDPRARQEFTELIRLASGGPA